MGIETIPIHGEILAQIETKFVNNICFDGSELCQELSALPCSQAVQIVEKAIVPVFLAWGKLPSYYDLRNEGTILLSRRIAAQLPLSPKQKAWRLKPATWREYLVKYRDDYGKLNDNFFDIGIIAQFDGDRQNTLLPRDNWEHVCKVYCEFGRYAKKREILQHAAQVLNEHNTLQQTRARFYVCLISALAKQHPASKTFSRLQSIIEEAKIYLPFV